MTFFAVPIKTVAWFGPQTKHNLVQWCIQVDGNEHILWLWERRGELLLCLHDTFITQIVNTFLL